jgi:hypothetical protein
MMKARKMRWMHALHMGEKILMNKLEGKRYDFSEIGWGGIDWFIWHRIGASGRI